MAKLIVAVGVFKVGAVPPSTVVCTENTLFLVWTSPLVFKSVLLSFLTFAIC